MSYIDVTGKTENEAIEKALLQLNLDRDDVSVEILERARTGFLGIGSSPAKVRVTYGEEETAAEVGRKPLFTPEKIADKAEKKEEKPAEKKPAVKVAAPVDKEALRKELASFEKSVNDFDLTYGLNLTQYEFDALVSFTYNLGAAWMRGDNTQLLKKAVLEDQTGNDFIVSCLDLRKLFIKILSCLRKSVAGI